MKKVSATRWLVLAAYAFLINPFGQSAPAPSPLVVVTLLDGSQLTGTVQRTNNATVTIMQTNFQEQVVQIDHIVSCSMVVPGARSISIGGNHCAPMVADIHYDGFQSASLSVGYTGSAQRDENATGTIEFVSYQGLDTKTLVGSFRGKTDLFLKAAYDDKWKHTPDSSNVTQNDSGQLQETIYSRRSPQTKCETDPTAIAYQITGHAYRNNSQGIQVDQSYGFGISKTLLFINSKDAPQSGCSRPDPQFRQILTLGADIRSVNYLLYSPGGTDHGFGSQLQLSYTAMFPSRQSLAIQIGGVPVFDRSDMSQASGTFYYAAPLSASWAIVFNVQDDYYEIAPKTFNKNYVATTAGIKFTPPRTAPRK